MRLFSFLNYFRNVSNAKMVLMMLRMSCQSFLSMTSPPLLREESRLTEPATKNISYVHEVFKLKFWSGADETLQSIDKSLSL